MHDGGLEDWGTTVGLPAGPVCGAGILVDSTHVVTCAHSVPGGRLTPHGVAVGFPTVDGPRTQSARVVGWFPPGPDDQGDIAVLELDGPPPSGVRPARARHLPVDPGREVWLRRYGFGGDAVTEAYARVAGPPGGAGQRLRLEDVRPGTRARDVALCGAGVVDAATGDVLGMVVAEEHFAVAPMAWMIRLTAVAGLYRPTRAGSPAAASGRRPAPVMELTRAVAELPTMSSPHGRDQMIGALPRQTANAIPRHTETRFDVWGIVRTCLEYPDGLTVLVELLRAFEGDSEPMRRVDAIVSELFPPRPV
jgi:hypothetical protein